MSFLYQLLQEGPTLLWRFCDSGAAYETPNLLTYLFHDIKIAAMMTENRKNGEKSWLASVVVADHGNKEE